MTGLVDESMYFTFQILGDQPRDQLRDQLGYQLRDQLEDLDRLCVLGISPISRWQWHMA